jgi:DNA helicase-2/ATP-dependent DNA helicase PcrA
MPALWRAALGAGRQPSPDQEAAIVAPPTGRRSVNAGAGTGKTATLALRALYLIEAGHMRADQIVVVTFTNKAAAEVGSRIADTLDRALANGAPFVSSERSVKCTTIHALAAEILREFAFESGAPAPLRPITDGEAYGIFHASFRALLDGRLAVDTASFPIAELNLDVLEHDLAKLALRLKNYGVTPDAFASRALAQTERFARQSWGQLWSLGKSNKRVGLEPKTALTSAELVCEAGRERANIALVGALLADFDRRLVERNAATYGDLIGLATRLLNERPNLVTRLRERWRYVLLDESQDTSEIQLRFMETLFGKPGDLNAAGMMPVGDTRQAIYGFNGAAENVMERLAAAAEASHPLVVNRRSPQEIVDAGNAVLTKHALVADAPSLVASAGLGGLTCVRLQTFGEPGEPIKEHVEREAAAIACEIERLLHDGSAASSDIAILVRRRTHARAYVRALNDRGISAALDRRSGLFVADEIRDALAWASLLLDLRDGQAAVRVLQSPLGGISDAAMIALTVRKDWLERFLRDDLDADVDVGADTRSRLDRVRTLLTVLLPAAALPLRAAMATILAEIPIAASYVQSGPAIGTQAIINLRSFEELAREFAAERSDARLDDFVADAKRRIAFDDDPQEPELELTGVRILTIHQAKGLEWPYVFVACSTKNQYGNSEPTDRVVAYDRGSGAFALKNDIDGRETFHWMTLNCEHDPDTGLKVPGPVKAAHEREQARVFYVAVTRAKRRVYITAPAPAGRGEAPFLEAIRTWAESVEPGADLRFDTGSPVAGARAPGAAADGMERLVSPSFAVVPSPAVPALRPRISFTALSAFATCPRMARLRYRLKLPDLRRARARFVGFDEDDWVPSNAARLGSLAHRALELWGRAAIEQRLLAIDDAFAGALLEFADAQPDEIERARSSARHAVSELAGYQVLAVEAPFELAVDETHVEGYIDLIAREPGGRLVVVDYKTGRTEDEHYALQIALYRRVAEQRYPGETAAGAILRLTPEGATLVHPAPLGNADVDRAVAQAGSFDSDAARVGPWCTSCAYRGSPCMAPFAQAG